LFDNPYLDDRSKKHSAIMGLKSQDINLQGIINNNVYMQNKAKQ
jgi:hypothetical protein